MCNKSGFEGSEAKEEKRTADSWFLHELRHPDGNDLLSAHRVIDERASSAYGGTLPQRTVSFMAFWTRACLGWVEVVEPLNDIPPPLTLILPAGG